MQMIAENGNLSTNGITFTSPAPSVLDTWAAESEVNPSEPVQSKITELLAHISKAPSKSALQSDILKNVSEYITLTESELEQVRAAVEKAGVTATWWNRDFKPVLRRQAKANQPNESGTISNKIRTQLKELGYEFSYNLCTGETLVNGDPINDGTAATIRVQMRDAGTSSIKAVEDIYTADAHQNRFHPVQRYLNSLQWDGQDHIAALASHVTDSHEPIKYSDGSERTVFHAFLRRFLIGAVARAYRRGVQVPMLVLSGAQGRGKSFLAKWLCPLPDMLIESAIYPDNSDHMKYLASKWIWAVDELGATTRRADIEGLKAFITKDVATFRAAYARYGSNLSALACFIGTVNDSGAGFLNDPTGNRRFAAVDLTSIERSYSTVIDTNQVWAQASVLYQAGESWTFTAEEVEASSLNAESHQATDPVTEVIARHFTIGTGNSMTADEIMDCLIKTHDFKLSKDSAFATKIGIAMKKLEIEKERVSVNGVRIYKYIGITHTPNKEI